MTTHTLAAATVREIELADLARFIDFFPPGSALADALAEIVKVLSAGHDLTIVAIPADPDTKTGWTLKA